MADEVGARPTESGVLTYEERLITEVQKYPVLFDVTSSSYKDADKKDLLWQAIDITLDSNGKF